MVFDEEYYYRFVIEPEDTDNKEYGKYKFDVQIEHDGVKSTLALGDFEIQEEVTFADANYKLYKDAIEKDDIDLIKEKSEQLDKTIQEIGAEIYQQAAQAAQAQQEAEQAVVYRCYGYVPDL